MVIKGFTAEKYNPKPNTGSDALPISNRDQNRKILEASPNGALPPVGKPSIVTERSLNRP